MDESAGHNAHYSQGARREVLGAVARAGCIPNSSCPRTLGIAAWSCLSADTTGAGTRNSAHLSLFFSSLLSW